MRVAGKKCLVTGAASGIGRATALATAARGGEVFLTDIQAEALEATADEIRAAGGKVGHVAALDIRDYDAVRAMADEIHAGHGSLDVVMNVAGISIWGTVDKLSHDQWRRVVDINLMGPIHVIECFVPPMIEAGRGGHLVNVSSAAGLFGLPWHAAYSAAKFGLRGVSEVLRFDLRRHGIGVSLVCPGGVKTPLVGTVEIAGVDRDNPRIRKLTARFEDRAATPEHVAECILRGIEKNRYLVFTSRDIRIGHFFQRKFALPYEIAMRVMNDRLSAVAASEGGGLRARSVPSPAVAGRTLRYVDPQRRRGVVYRLYAALVGTRLMGWVSRQVAWKLDPHLLSVTRGRLGTGLVLPTALLETRGARSGQPRRNGVIYFHDREKVVIVASKLGMATHPAWLHNLRANPDVVLGGQPFRAQVVEDETERQRLWMLADRVFPRYAAYRARAARAGRTIPIVQLTPR